MNAVAFRIRQMYRAKYYKIEQLLKLFRKQSHFRFRIVCEMPELQNDDIILVCGLKYINKTALARTIFQVNKKLLS